ncbi:MAG: HigA family addiction module antitoxin [Chloroflexi bacterium]|nr:HigA family addiction module antitoxin [Chloroflexota bacterium]
MAETFPYIESDAPVSHPGWLLNEELDARGMSQRELARRIRRPFQVVNEIVRGRKAITAETALQLEGEFGTPAYLWLSLQADYDLDVARRKMEAAQTAP